MGENNLFPDSIEEVGQDGEMSTGITSFCYNYEKK
jgi:hypothetical protein